MRMPVIAVIGGSQANTLQQIARKNECSVLFHNGKIRNGGTRKEFRPIIKKADVVVINLGAISHVTMNLVKELCKKTGTPIVFHDGFGASGAILTGLRVLQSDVQLTA